MAQLPNVKLKIHPSTFDLMMAVLEDASVQMYESEAAEMIWQLLIACGGTHQPKKEYSKELKRGGGHDGG